MDRTTHGCLPNPTLFEKRDSWRRSERVPAVRQPLQVKVPAKLVEHKRPVTFRSCMPVCHTFRHIERLVLYLTEATIRNAAAVVLPTRYCSI